MADENVFDQKASLSLKVSDYEKAGKEVPEFLINNPTKTEGEIMSDADIISWIVDSRKTFSIIKQENVDTFKNLYAGYLLDVKYLVKIGRLDEDTADDLLNIDNFEF